MLNTSLVGNDSRNSLIASVESGSSQASSQSSASFLGVQQSSEAPETQKTEDGIGKSEGKPIFTQVWSTLKYALAKPVKTSSEKTGEQSTSNATAPADVANTSSSTDISSANETLHTSDGSSSASLCAPITTPFQLSVEERRKLFDGTANSSSLTLKSSALVPTSSKRVSRMAAMFEKGVSINNPIPEPSTPAKPDESELAQQHMDVAASKPSEPSSPSILALAPVTLVPTAVSTEPSSPSILAPTAVSDSANLVSDLLEDLEFELETLEGVLEDLKEKEETAIAEGRSDVVILIRDTTAALTIRKTSLESKLRKLGQDSK